MQLTIDGWNQAACSTISKQYRDGRMCGYCIYWRSKRQTGTHQSRCRIGQLRQPVSPACGAFKRVE